MQSPDTFRFLGQSAAIASANDWNNPALEKLWLYNLHYFDDLNADDAQSRSVWHQTLLHRWVTENPPVAGNGWEPYPSSLRIVNWIKWSLAGNTLSDECLHSLYIQTRWLSKRLEWHLLGNHLFANAKALVFSALFFEGEETRRWLETGLQIIDRELQEQVLPDGGNFELSTMYHAIFLEDVLDLINIAVAYQDKKAIQTRNLQQWKSLATKMLSWLEAMIHPDGEIAFFNDASTGIAPSFASLKTYANRLDVPVLALDGNENKKLSLMVLPDSGYVRMQSPNALALLDVARIGPDYLPGHAHADTLSFELSVFGKRLIVNGGTSRYGAGALRLRERETAWHSTVEVAGQNSSEVWSGFRVGRRAYPFDFRTSMNDTAIGVACSHNGYRYLPGQPDHRRVWDMGVDHLRVTDTLSNIAVPAVARFIFHPDILVSPDDASKKWKVSMSHGRTASVTVETGSAQLIEAWYAPAFGALVKTTCLLVNLVDGKAITCIEWS